jgi:hypothetical protein
MYHFIREHQQQGNIDVCYISTIEQLADLFTKVLFVDHFRLLQDTIGLTPLLVILHPERQNDVSV